MNTSTNTLYESYKLALLDKKSGESISKIPEELQADAEKALDGAESVEIPKDSSRLHLNKLARFAANQRQRKKKKNRSSSQSRRKNRK